ncbi:hypothetical protein APHAL10511_006228 [Amanita phalloides]|nr:hypothetical protein APHAL10511_006228 [Amanita phalloides]
MSSRSFNTTSHSHPPHWPPEPIPPVGYLSRKALPIKKNDADPLTRKDLQYDMLEYIFTDKTAVFTSPLPDKTDKMTFRDLYVSTVYNSSKCSKVLKEKMVDTPAFAIELAKLSLLTNVGRINTTMAFFPEMKTALRTYHPVPSLQKTDGNAQDAPRIKNCLKAALLPSEAKGVPASTPEEILDKSRVGLRPPTSVVNLIFVLANHAAPLSSVHFEGGFNFLDLFLPGRGLASDDRGRCFLWMMFYYLEHHQKDNPFHDEYSEANSPKAPKLRPLTDEELSNENVDTPEEIEWGHKMSVQRNTFLQRLVASLEREKREKSNPSAQFDTGLSTVSVMRSKKPMVDLENSSGQPSTRAARPESTTYVSSEKNFINYVPDQQCENRGEPIPGGRHELDHIQHQEPHQERRQERPRQQRSQQSTQQYERRRQEQSASVPRERTMIEQAWYSIMTTDPLADSDEEPHDEHARRDYIRRREILQRYTGLTQVPDPD